MGYKKIGLMVLFLTLFRVCAVIGYWLWDVTERKKSSNF
jgi:hypothetical protein